jgi:hypothetical protein
MTATLLALKNRWMDAASARCSRACITLIEVSVASIGNSNLITPSSNPPATWYPASRKIWIIRWFSGSTSATNFSTPRSRPAWARCSSSSCAMPLPWCASCTRNATSATLPRPSGRDASVPGASSGWMVSNRPTAMIFLATVSTNATRSWWSTCVNRLTSRSESLGIGAKNRMYFDSAETCS